MLLEGLYLPLTTPFYPDGSLNLRKLEHNADRYSRTPAAGFAVLSEVGEAYDAVGGWGSARRCSQPLDA